MSDAAGAEQASFLVCLDGITAMSTAQRVAEQKPNEAQPSSSRRGAGEALLDSGERPTLSPSEILRAQAVQPTERQADPRAPLDSHTREGSRDYVPGDVIAGKYRLVRVLSRGGMGAVWVAHNELLDIQVALKLIRHDLRADFLAERLLTEARIAARLDHPAVVTVYDVGNTDIGDPYIVMELLKGEDLRDLLEREARMLPARAVQMLLPIAEGLHAAHLHGVVHRDLKPENIYFSNGDDRMRPKIVDFGIAKHSEPRRGRRITRSGAVVGSPDYMSPEQARGDDDVDHRADIWAFCVVLYECIAGQPPFAESPYECLLTDIVDKPAPPIAQFGITDDELWQVLARGLSKERDARWQNMRELGAALAEWLRVAGVEEDVCGHSLRATWLRESHPGLRVEQSSAPEIEVVELPASEIGELLEPAVEPSAPFVGSLSGIGEVAAVSARPAFNTPTPTSWFRGELHPSSEPPLPAAAATRTAPAWLRRSIGAIALAAAFTLWLVVAGLVMSVSVGANSRATSAEPTEPTELRVGITQGIRGRADSWLTAQTAPAEALDAAVLFADLPVEISQRAAPPPRRTDWRFTLQARPKAAARVAQAATETTGAPLAQPAPPPPRRTRAGVLIDPELGF
jgi:serine/threonine protein kinase